MADAPASVAAFHEFDKDGSGDIDGAELRHALEAAGLTVSDAQTAYLLRKYDGDRGKTLDLEEFCGLVDDLRNEQGSDIQLRLGLRTHSGVLAILAEWWQAVVSSLDAPSSTGDTTAPAPVLDHAGYVVVMKKIFKAMTEHWDETEAEAIAETEWDNDRRGLNYLDAELFKDGLWALETECPSLSARLRSLYCELGARKAHAQCARASARRKPVPQV